LFYDNFYTNLNDVRKARACIKKIMSKGKRQIAKWGYLSETFWADGRRELSDFVNRLEINFNNKQILFAELENQTLELETKQIR